MIEEGAKVAVSTIDAMKSTPLAIALLVVNVGFLGFAAYVLGEVAANAQERNKSQVELVSSLVKDIKDMSIACRTPAPTKSLMFRHPGPIYPFNVNLEESR